jgi:DNA-binding PadR family transcriptional regulator
MMFPYKKHWMRHTAMVPKGFVRYQVLESLSEKSMSGSEIINEIDNRTEGRWKPSPGSIYPLLAWLQDNGYVKELPVDQNGMKRYELTESGRSLLKEQKKIFEEHRKMIDERRNNFRKFITEGGFFGGSFAHAPWVGPSSEKTGPLRQSARRLARAFIQMYMNLDENFSEDVMREVQNVFEEATERLNGINEKLKGTRSE